ncbi:TetR/AcrR family transcriptional regulator [Mesorhizobium erdmanii]|uniref:TetR/AcrR family transcriptional regulator n=1 Tax=Mesorhizobium erdmanii TaxID=1777866 RepID=UPI000409E00D|nr:TetR/AcrR family transcriptional regulator [Mesorhizobium erdmanii]
MRAQRPNSREKILAAAADVARESGPGSLSLEAVASRAGVSKGGLLYNFPTKAKLMQGLVEGYLRDFEQALETANGNDGGANPLAVYIKLSANDCEEKQPSASWIFSAIAEDPDFMTPIKTFKQQLFERLKGETNDLKSLLVCYVAIEGLRSMNLFDSGVLSKDERELLVASLLEIAGSPDAEQASGMQS